MAPGRLMDWTDCKRISAFLGSATAVNWIASLPFDLVYDRANSKTVALTAAGW